jgi:hypothetical protein
MEPGRLTMEQWRLTTMEPCRFIIEAWKLTNGAMDVGSVGQWLQLRIILMNIRLRIRIKVKSRIWIRIKVKSWIRTRNKMKAGTGLASKRKFRSISDQKSATLNYTKT